MEPTIDTDWLQDFKRRLKCGNFGSGTPMLDNETLTGIGALIYDFMTCQFSGSFTTIAESDDYSPTLKQQYEQIKCQGTFQTETEARVFIAKVLSAGADACNE